MRIIKPIVVQCNECNEIIEVEVDLECVSTDERSMGEELGYEGVIEDECPICGNQIEIQISVWEYPVGAVNFSEERCQGVELLEAPIYDPYENDNFSDNY